MNYWPELSTGTVCFVVGVLARHYWRRVSWRVDVTVRDERDQSRRVRANMPGNAIRDDEAPR